MTGNAENLFLPCDHVVPGTQPTFDGKLTARAAVMSKPPPQHPCTGVGSTEAGRAIRDRRRYLPGV